MNMQISRNVILDLLRDHRVKLDHAHKYNGVECLYKKASFPLTM